MVLNFWSFSRLPFDLLRLLKLSKVPKTRHGLQGLEAAYLDAKAGTGGDTIHATQASAESFELLTLLNGVKTCHVAVSKSNRNSLWGLGMPRDVPWCRIEEPSKAAAEGFELLRLLILFKLPKTCHVAVSKPNRNSLQGLEVAILRDFLKIWKVECRAGIVPMRFAIFAFRLSTVLHLPRKSEATSFKVLHLSRKITLANLRTWCSKMQPVRKSAPWPPNIFDEDVSCIAPSTQNSSLQILFKCPTPAVSKTPTFCSLLARCGILCACHTKWRLNVQKLSEHVVLLACWLRNMLRATTPFTFSSSELPKVLWTRCVFNMYTSKCASRHNKVRFWNIWTAKSAPKLRRFAHFDFEIGFAPSRRAIFHLSSPQVAPHPRL